MQHSWNKRWDRLVTVDCLPGADAWVSVGCSLQHSNPSLRGPEYRDKNKRKRKKLLRNAEVFMDKVLSLGGRVAFELPAENELWNDAQFKKFEEDHVGCIGRGVVAPALVLAVSKRNGNFASDS